LLSCVAKANSGGGIFSSGAAGVGVSISSSLGPRAPQHASLSRSAIWWRGGGICRPSRDHAATEKLALSFPVRATHLGEGAKLAQYSRRMRRITDAPASITLANVPSASQRWRRVAASASWHSPASFPGNSGTPRRRKTHCNSAGGAVCLGHRSAAGAARSASIRRWLFQEGA
jgi:hypothetical protein